MEDYTGISGAGDPAVGNPPTPTVQEQKIATLMHGHSDARGYLSWAREDRDRAMRLERQKLERKCLMWDTQEARMTEKGRQDLKDQRRVTVHNIWKYKEDIKRKEGWRDHPKVEWEWGLKPQTPWTEQRAGETLARKSVMDQVWKRLGIIQGPKLEQRLYRLIHKEGPWGAGVQAYKKKLVARPGYYKSRLNQEIGIWDMDCLPQIIWDQICPHTYWIPDGPYNLTFRWEQSTGKQDLTITMPPKCRICKAILDYRAAISIRQIGNIFLEYCSEHYHLAGLSQDDIDRQYRILWDEEYGIRKVWHPQDFHKWGIWEQEEPIREHELTQQYQQHTVQPTEGKDGGQRSQVRTRGNRTILRTYSAPLRQSTGELGMDRNGNTSSPAGRTVNRHAVEGLAAWKKVQSPAKPDPPLPKRT